MAVQVNPPPHLKIPRKFLQDDEVLPYLRNIEVILFQLWNRTGGDNDSVDDGQQEQTASSSRVSRNAAQIGALELKEFEVINTTVDLTTSLNQIIICRNTLPIEITLNTQAIEGDEIHIKRRNASIDVIGSIDGFTNKTINVLNYSMHLVFDGIDWSEI